MFFYVLLISTTNFLDSHLNYLNNQIYRSVYNFVGTEESIQQNTIFENLLCTDKTKKKNEVETECNQRISKFPLDSGCMYEQRDQHIYETGNFFTMPNKDNKELFQITNPAILFGQDYLTNSSANTIFKNKAKSNLQYCNDVLSATDFSDTKIFEKELSTINSDSFSTQAGSCFNINLHKQMENISAVQENKFLANQLKAGCIDNYIEPNNQKYEYMVFENELYKEIERYINLVDSDFIHCNIDKYSDVYNKKYSEDSNSNVINFFNGSDLIINNKKEQEKGNADFAADHKPSKSLTSENSNIEISDILKKNKKELQALKDKFYLNIRKRSYRDHIDCHLNKNSKYCIIRRRIYTYCIWFKTFESEIVKIFMGNLNSYFSSANTKNLFFDSVELLREIAQFFIDIKDHFYLQQYNQCDIISNVTLAENIIKEMVLNFNYEKIDDFMKQTIKKIKKNSCSSSKKVTKEDYLHVLCNIERFKKKFKLYAVNITMLKEFFEVNFNK